MAREGRGCMAQAEDIAACPFCGATDLLMMDDEGKFYILCLDCRACGPCEDHKEEALLSWCDRPASADLGPELEKKFYNH